LLNKLENEYDSNYLGSWRLDYRSLRAAPSFDDPNIKDVQHILHLSNQPRHLYVAFETAQDPFILTLIPASSATDYNNMLSQQMSMLWTPRSALSLNGSRWEVGSTGVYLGELRINGGNQAIRAVVVAFQTKLEEAVDDDMLKESHEAAKEKVSALLETMGIEGAKEYWGFGKRRDIVKAWCNALSK
jgi:hypothetical protein